MYIDFQASTNVTWVILDSVSVSEAVKHNSKYGYILFCALFGSATAPFVSAYTIKDGEHGVNGMKRKTKIVRNIIDLAYYTFNVYLLVRHRPFIAKVPNSYVLVQKGQANRNFVLSD